MNRVYLNDKWQLYEAPLNWEKDMSGYVSRQNDGWLEEISLPCDVHIPLIKSGKLNDPVVADFCYAAEWIEERSWWFKREFAISSKHLESEVAELTIEAMDVHGDVFINGAWIGHHASAHYPFQTDIKPWLQEGRNELLVRLTCGLENIDDQDLSKIDYAVCTEANNNYPDRGDKRRAFVRKPAYVFGWDWCPRIATCGITKSVWLSFANKIAIRDVHIYTKELQTASDGSQRALISTEICTEFFDIIGSSSASLKAIIVKDGETVAIHQENDCYLKSGINYFSFEITLEQAQLWWPNDMGQQPLYELRLEISNGNEISTYQPVIFAVRTINLITKRIDEKTRDFALEVNGHRVFCKGANWIPADSIYARVSDEKYCKLIQEAQNAHFNMLRIWGGGIYERDVFYEECDKRGILIWHDFMFGCSTYPDHLEQFYDLVRREIDYQTKRLRNHACIALFCGNNENHWIFTSPGFSDSVKIRQSKQYGLKISNVLCPEIVRYNCPEIPYWNSSPYGGYEPNSPLEGDVHHWHACMMNPDMSKRITPQEYDLLQAQFVSEYGYPGPCAINTIQDYFGDHPIDRKSKIWHLHNNTFEKHTVSAGIAKHYTGKDLTLDEYLLYAGMTQAHILGYSLEAMRFKSSCNGSLFWMYNDCWGEVGWTIIDYYLRRKIAYYAVRRSFLPQKLILRQLADGKISVTGCNDGPDEFSIDVAYGFISHDGRNKTETKAKITLKAFIRETVLTFVAPCDRKDIICYVRPVDTMSIVPGILYIHDIRQLGRIQSKAVIKNTLQDGSDLLIEIKAETFCHGVHLQTDTDHSLSDNYFDLLPGETRIIRIEEGAGCRPELKMIDMTE